MESYIPVGLHQRLGERSSSMISSVPGPWHFVSFCIQFARVCWLFSSSWRNCEGWGGNENGNHFLIWADTCWKKEDFQNRRLLFSSSSVRWLYIDVSVC